jgi:hypothetical protein
MNSPEDSAARHTLRIAGVFQEIRDVWIRRLEDYFDRIESLIDGQWMQTQDMAGVVREAKSASREALDGLGADLSSELVHESHGIFKRFEVERQTLTEEINDLRFSLAAAISGDEGLMQRENERMRHALATIPEYRLLAYVRELGRASYDELVEISQLKKSQVRKHAKTLMEKGHVVIDKKARPHVVVFLSAPWRTGSEPNEESSIQSCQMNLDIPAHQQ